MYQKFSVEMDVIIDTGIGRRKLQQTASDRRVQLTSN